MQQRVTRVEVQRRPAHVAALLVQLRQCDAAQWQGAVLDVLTTVDRATGAALALALTDAEWEAVLGVAYAQYLDALQAVELDALIHGDPLVIRRVQQWIRARHHQEDSAQ